LAGPELAFSPSVAGSDSIPLWKAGLPIAVLILLLAMNVYLYGDDAIGGPNQLALIFAAAIAAIVGCTLKIPFEQMIEGIKNSIHSALGAMLILLLIGALIGTWVISGIVPALIYYGLEILDAKIFLGAAVIVCSIVSLATGSSWSTVGTVGVALMGIGQALGVSPGLTAGAIISGAYFGDKVSPLSDTTNLAAAMAGTPLITHIRYLMYTTVPSIVITLAIFFAIGYSGDSQSSGTETAALQSALSEQFNLTPWLFTVPAFVLLLVMRKVDPLIALFLGALLGGIFAAVLQPQIITGLSGYSSTIQIREEAENNQENGTDSEMGPKKQAGQADTIWRADYPIHCYKTIMNALGTKIKVISTEQTTEWEQELAELESLAVRAESPTAEAGVSPADRTGESPGDWSKIATLRGRLAAAELMEGKGMEGMLPTIWLIICAMCFGGIMEACGLLRRIANGLLSFANSIGSLVATTAGSCLFLNLTASDQYLAIVVPGRMFREIYRQRGLAPENLSRTLEDSGTVTSVLVPWNTCGAAQSSVLSLSTWAFAPFCFFNWISPLMTMLFAFAQIKIARLNDQEASDQPD
jgi:NhaC family Na+:H+ antiporter